eukprot:m.294555 g.294555  ORF g.294555 m.294555 type:complete len:50 (-) comp241062_c0_seq1:110-259(-)
MCWHPHIIVTVVSTRFACRSVCAFFCVTPFSAASQLPSPTQSVYISIFH